MCADWSWRELAKGGGGNQGPDAAQIQQLLQCVGGSFSGRVEYKRETRWGLEQVTIDDRLGGTITRGLSLALLDLLL